MIEVNGLHKRFGEVVAVDGVSFSAADGKITGLLGPNGAGKTTTLRMLYTLLSPDSGTARVDGVDIATEPMRVRQRLGVLPDARGIYPRLSAKENIRYFGWLHGLSGVTLEQRISELVDTLEMKEIANRRAEGFSQGERVKVAIGRALVHNPQNLLLDEPTNGLDVMSTRAMREVLRTLRNQGRCVILSSHIMQEVSALCDHMVIVARGKVVANGTPEELRNAFHNDDLEDVFVSAIKEAR